MKAVLGTLALLFMVALGSARAESPIKVVAAENFYGDVAKQIGGPDVDVTSILSNPDQDPHLFEASPSIARDLSGAQLVIYNGIDYDPWMEKLLGAARSDRRTVVVVADIGKHKAGDNPHIWYDVDTMLALAQTLANDFSAADPAHGDDFNKRLSVFRGTVLPVQETLAALRGRSTGIPVTATEPVFGYMFNALGMVVRDQSFQLSIMNNTEPSASDMAAFENDLKAHQVKLLVYNAQASDPVADRMEALAKASGIPVVGAAETEPQGKTYSQWMLDELDQVAKALPQ